ncbi:hypothetical protein [Mycobacterium hubeiense]|uniref:hypothetical protein n=1 Tax=Mycobacterium hubeiense TaxID=1867256 RepID=UPI001E54609D|nr:hypothetical protein [Mycobacterium sp. QGD 101]
MTSDAPLSYRLHIVAPTVLDVVRNAGGYLFDRSMAGWKVTVALREPADPTPLVILGAETASRPADFVQTLAVCADLYDQLRDVDAAEVLLWGRAADTGDTGRVQYRLSSAARVFKEAALRAAGVVDADAATVETFRSRARTLTA